MNHIQLFEAFSDALKFIMDKRRGECNLEEIWTKLGGKFNWCGKEIDLKEFTINTRRGKVLLPVVISEQFDSFMCFLESISFSNGTLMASVRIESSTEKKHQLFPLSEVNLDRSQEKYFFNDTSDLSWKNISN